MSTAVLPSACRVQAPKKTPNYRPIQMPLFKDFLSSSSLCPFAKPPCFFFQPSVVVGVDFHPLCSSLSALDGGTATTWRRRRRISRSEPPIESWIAAAGRIGGGRTEEWSREIAKKKKGEKKERKGCTPHNAETSGVEQRKGFGHVWFRPSPVPS